MRGSEISVGGWYVMSTFRKERVKVLEKLDKGHWLVLRFRVSNGQARVLKNPHDAYAIHLRGDAYEMKSWKKGDEYEGIVESRDLLYPITEDGVQLPCKSWDEKRFKAARSELRKREISESVDDAVRLLGVLGFEVERKVQQFAGGGPRKPCVVISGVSAAELVELVEGLAKDRLAELLS